jgi:hypothetical protein
MPVVSSVCVIRVRKWSWQVDEPALPFSRRNGWVQDAVAVTLERRPEAALVLLARAPRDS